MIAYTGLDGTEYEVEGTIRPFKDGKPGDLFTYGQAPTTTFSWIKLNDLPYSNCQANVGGRPGLGLVYPNAICRWAV